MTLSSWLILFLSFLCSILLMIAPIAPWLSDIWPIWIIPLIIYWLMALPHRVGLCAAWFSGLILDVLFNSILGAHALALLLLAALFNTIARRFSFFSTLQQMIVIMFFTAIYLAILSLVQFFTIQSVTPIWWPIITTGLIWPIVWAILRYYRQYFRMT